MAKKIKLIFLINEISDGGAETLVKDYALHLDRDIYDIFIVTEIESDVNSANYRTLRKKGVKIFCPFFNFEKKSTNAIPIYVQNIIHTHIPKKIIDVYKKWYIKHIILRLKPNIIHSHMTVLKYLVPCKKNLKGIKLFYTCHSLPRRYFNSNECKEELEAASFLIKNHSLMLIGLHSEMQNELNAMFNINNTIIIHNGIDLEKFHNVRNCKEKKQIRNNLHIPENAFVLGHIGRFIWIKNQSFIVDVFLEIIKRKSNSFLLLIGNGDSSETVKKLSSYGLDGKYSILSNRQDIPELLLCMDAFIFPSFFEGFPLACIEAQAMGLKCFISDSVTKDVFFNSKAIPISLKKTSQSWANAILDNEIQGPYHNDINNFDLTMIVNQLGTLYGHKT